MPTEPQDEKTLAGNAWDQITSGIEGATQELADMRAGFVNTVTEGAVFRKFEKVLVSRLGTVEWKWPWFETSLEMFREWDVWPQMWPDLTPDEEVVELEEYSADELAIFRREQISPLISHAASKIYYRSLSMRLMPTGITWRLAYTSDTAEKLAAEPYEAAILAGDISILPPFFPGDRTSLQFVMPQHRST
ncbi:hypothetical protein [Agrobacterium vitis]